MILVLADRDDAAACWLTGALRPHLDAQVRLVTPIQLVCARGSQQLSSGGGEFRFDLTDGTKLDTASVCGVVNRMATVPTAHLAGADEVDRQYAAGELHAFHLGWMSSLDGPVLNSPSPESLCGPWHSPTSALHFASMAGLYCDAEQQDADTSVIEKPDAGDMTHFVFDGQVIGPVVPSKLRDALLGFALLWGARLVQIETMSHPRGRRFLSASSLVDYRRGGAALVGALVRVLAR